MKDILDLKEEFAEASKTWADPDWAITSKALADSVHGENFVVLGTTFAPTSFWVRVERPALLERRRFSPSCI
ncbi:hypothetical protein BJ165DRAFT_1475845 [Panaeolus papilionaceus]|nr:hypothetical protein BJ165DRAFT_1475845 [Panaeolus papilionaceus]